MGSSVERLVCLGATKAHPGENFVGAKVNVETLTELSWHVVGVYRRQQVVAPSSLVFGDIVTQSLYYSRVKTFRLAVGLWVALGSGNVIHPKNNTHYSFLLGSYI